MPADVYAAPLRARRETDPGGQGIKLATTTDAGLPGQDVNTLAAEILARAHAPTV
jgi:hypothetical protein